LILAPLLPLEIPAADDRIDSISIVTESWDTYTNLNGSGLYLDISRAVFEPRGVQLEIEYVPYKRALHLLESQKADAMYGTYSAEKEGKPYLLTPRFPIDTEQTAAIFNRSKNAEWRGQESLSGHSIAWVRGYDYHENLEIKVDNFTEVRDSAQGLKMLQGNRIDYFLDHAGTLRDTMERLEFDANAYQIEIVIEENVYMAFAATAKGEALADMYDLGLSQLIESGELQNIFARYDLIYPFANQASD